MSLKMKNLLVLAVLGVVLMGCSKERSRKWMIIDLSITSAITGEPLDARLELEMRDRRIPLSQPEDLIREPLGETVDGKFFIEKEIDRNFTQFRLYVFADDEYYTHPFSEESDIVGLTSTRKNEIELELSPRFFEIETTVINTACTDDTDSLWIRKIFDNGNEVEPALFTGCYNQVTDMLPTISFESNISYEVTRKRAGVTDKFMLDYELESNKLNQITIEY